MVNPVIEPRVQIACAPLRLPTCWRLIDPNRFQRNWRAAFRHRPPTRYLQSQLVFQWHQTLHQPTRIAGAVSRVATAAFQRIRRRKPGGYSPGLTKCAGRLSGRGREERVKCKFQNAKFKIWISGLTASKGELHGSTPLTMKILHFAVFILHLVSSASEKYDTPARFLKSR